MMANILKSKINDPNVANFDKKPCFGKFEPLKSFKSRHCRLICDMIKNGNYKNWQISLDQLQNSLQLFYHHTGKFQVLKGLVFFENCWHNRKGPISY